MSTGEEAPDPRPSSGKGRLEAFSDGVFAIAITLLVLDIVVHPPGSPLEQVLNAWPAYLTYVISFFAIGAAWIDHTALTERLERSDSVFLRLNLLLLLVVAFLPFPTRLLAEGQGHEAAERVAVTMYGLTLLVIHILGYVLNLYARREHLTTTDGESAELQRDERKLLPAVVGSLIAIAVGFVSPTAAIALYLGLAVYVVVPFRDVGRLLFPRR
jgi:uncharacterized membrane protein